MKRILVIGLFSLVLTAALAPHPAPFGSHPAAAHEAGETGAAPAAAACETPVQLSEAAERRPGGALHSGAAHEHHGGQDDNPDMDGAHMVNKTHFGGAFFMAPNKLHHLEAVFAEDCGFRLFFYNAFTEHIRADRFRAFIKVVPNDEDELEMLRILGPSTDRTMLATPLTGTPERPFGIELYVTFPGSEEPQLFNVRIGAR